MQVFKEETNFWPAQRHQNPPTRARKRLLPEPALAVCNPDQPYWTGTMNDNREMHFIF